LVSFLAVNNLDAQDSGSHPLNIIDAPPVPHVCELPATDVDAHFFVRSNPEVMSRIKAKAQTMFDVDFSSSCGGNQWPQEAMEAFEFAMGIWTDHVQSDILMKVRANWAQLDERTLASTTPGRMIKLPQSIYGVPDTWYAISQISAMANRPLRDQLDEVNYDINMDVQCNRDDWYFGTDANVPDGRYDFVTVILHEIGHGLGFLGGFTSESDTETAQWAFDSPIIYDRFAVDGNGTNLIDTGTYPNPSQKLYDALVGDEGGVFFDGENANNSLADFGAVDRAQLFTPKPYRQGSSYSHVDLNTFNKTVNALMVSNIAPAFAVHTPGPLMCGMFGDMGWPLGEGCLDLIDSAIIASNADNLNFGVINLGETAQKTITLSNREDAELPLIGSFQIESDQFSIVERTSFSIEPGQSQEFNITYTPTDNVRQMSNLLIEHNGINEAAPLVIPLLGEALEEGRVVQLYQSYPNPFVQDNTDNLSSPIVEYSISEAADVLLDVYTVAGQHVLSLVNGRLNPGIYQQQVDLRGYTTGIYIYRIVVGGEVSTGKLMYVR
jgi:hypothetical protein